METKREIIRNGGFYHKGVWNSIITFPNDNKLYRHRVETLILKGDSVYLGIKKDGEYKIPGGSTERGLPAVEQAINECQEETRINVKNITPTGINYKEVKPYAKWMRDLPLKWDGMFSEVYVADYDSQYTGKIDREDQDDLVKYGQFYSIDEVYHKLRPEHQKAIKFARRGKEIKIPTVEESYQFEIVDDVSFPEIITESTDDKLYPVYIMLVHSGTTLSNAIKTVTKSTFSHSAISFDSSMQRMYTFGRKMDSNPFMGTFVCESLYSPFYQNREVPYALYVVPCTANEITRMKQRLNFFVRNSTKFRYDFTGLFKNYFGIVDNPMYKFFCSRFVADILNSGKPQNHPYFKNPSLVRPEDFAHQSFAKFVIGGMTKQYRSKTVDPIVSNIIEEEYKKRHSTLTTEKTIVNDKGEEVPEKCPKCGSPVKVFFRGEPVYLCSNKDCNKYFGTVPFDVNESTSDTKLLYHGSSKKYTILKPHMDHLTHHSDVYATPNYSFALAYAGNQWNDSQINQCMVDDKMHLTEIIPGIFKNTFDRDGYIHYINDEGFTKKNKHEFICPNTVKPFKVERVENILEALKKDKNTVLHTYPNLPPFIKDRDEYIKKVTRSWESAKKESVMTENVFISQDNLEINLDKWDVGNPLWITGASGDGKSTLAKKLADENNAEVIHTDMLLVRIRWSKEKFDSRMNMTIWNGTVMSEMKHPIIVKFINDHPEIPRELRWQEDAKGITEKWFLKFFAYVIEVSKRYPKKLIIEGCDIYAMSPSYMVDKPLIVMGGSIMRSVIRRAKRDVSEEGINMIASIFKQIKKIRHQIIPLINERDKFRRNVEHELSLTESASFTDVKNIVDKIPKNEHHFMYHGDSFKNSPYVKYRDTIYSGNEKSTGAFIEVYGFSYNPTEGIIVIGCEPDARGHGLTDTLVKRAIEKAPSIGFRRLIWKCDKKNIHSYKLALRNGFRVNGHGSLGSEYQLFYDL